MGFTYCGYVLSDYDLILIHSSLPVYLNILFISFTSFLGAETQETNNNKESKKDNLLFYIFFGDFVSDINKSRFYQDMHLLKKIYFV